MAVTSRFFQLNSNVLLEYIYADNNTPETLNTSSTGLYLLNNNYTNTKYLFSSDDQDLGTFNVRDKSSVIVDKTINKWAFLNIDIPLNYNDYDSNLTDSSNLSLTFTPDINIKYDTVKFHFVAGYDFSDFDGYIFEIKVKSKSGKLHNLSSLTYTKDKTYSYVNPRPFIMGERLFNSYVQIKIPALYYLIYEFESNPNNTNLLGYKLTSGEGLSVYDPIVIQSNNIAKTESNNGFTYYYTTVGNKFSINQIDDFVQVNASITESINGDYYELCGLVSGTTFEDFIFGLNTKSNSDWIVIHEVQVIEQLMLDFVETANLSFIQDSNYSDPFLYRPIILNSHIATSYTINYNLRLFNRFDNSQIIKAASLTSYNAKKWGRSLQKINLGTIPTIDKIYNQVVDTSFIQPSSGTNQISGIQYVANYYSSFNISIEALVGFKDVNNIFVSNNNQTSSKTIFGPGEAIIYLNPFDNYLKFKIYKQEKDNLVFNNILNLGTIYLVFKENNGEEFKYEMLADSSVNPSTGEVLFRINDVDSNRILGFSNKVFHLILSNGTGDNTVIYNGEFANIKNEVEKQKLEMILRLNAEITNLNQKLTETNLALTNAKTDLKNSEIILKNKTDELAIANSKLTAIAKGEDPNKVITQSNSSVAKFETGKVGVNAIDASLNQGTSQNILPKISSNGLNIKNSTGPFTKIN